MLTLTLRSGDPILVGDEPLRVLVVFNTCIWVKYRGAIEKCQLGEPTTIFDVTVMYKEKKNSQHMGKIGFSSTNDIWRRIDDKVERSAG